MPEYTQEPSKKFNMSKFFIDYNQGKCALVITLKDRKSADILSDVLIGLVRMSRFGGNTRFQFSSNVCEDLDDKEKSRVDENNKPIYPYPYKMVQVNGDVMQALHMLKDDITPEVLTAIQTDIKNHQMESKEEKTQSLGP